VPNVSTCGDLRFGGCGFGGLACTLNTLRKLFLVGSCVWGFPSLDGNSVRSVRACIGFDHLNVVTPLVAFALDDEPAVFYKAVIVPAKQPRQRHAAGVFQLRSRLADKSIEAPVRLTQLDDLRERARRARLHHFDQPANSLTVLVGSDDGVQVDQCPAQLIVGGWLFVVLGEPRTGKFWVSHIVER
jgi:hypothetical protein